uniref:Uncharacterized protein n=1 Tax=Anguilla anguilla TaxID=7936 RepID=A0A0E9U9Z8_ANGAN
MFFRDAKTQHHTNGFIIIFPTICNVGRSLTVV